MDWIAKIFILWISFDILAIATGWYLATTLSHLFPCWWRRVIVDDNS